MTDRTYLMIIALAGILLIIGVVFLAVTTDVFAPQSETDVEEIIIPEFKPIPEQSMDCEICHTHPEKEKKHIEGGIYCEPCHGTDLHYLHIKETTANISCVLCHSLEPIIPEKLPEHDKVCDTCHSYPDPIQPSYGNIITIHMTRGYSCTICHIQDIQSIHINSMNSS